MVENKFDYENVAVFSLKSGEEVVQNLIKKFTDLITVNAILEKTTEWGRKKLAYPINKETEGYYIVFNFKGAPEFPAELDRIYNITDGVLRWLIVRKELEKNVKKD